MAHDLKFASAGAEGPDALERLDELLDNLKTELAGRQVDAVFVFASPHFNSSAPDIQSRVRDGLNSRSMIGCSAMGVIGNGREWEHKPALSVTAAHLPGVRAKALYTDTTDTPDEDASPAAWADWLGIAPDEDVHFILLADPFSSATDSVLRGLDYAFPEGVKIGGLASGAEQPKGNILYKDDQVYRDGLVMLTLEGALQIDPIIAQGCRPLGESLIITQCDQNILKAVDGEPPLRYLERLAVSLSEEDQELVRTSLFLGLSIELWQEQGSEEYLVRNLIGVEQEAGNLAIGAMLTEGQKVRFHVRDKDASRFDLERLLIQYRDGQGTNPVEGALLFSCLGRGAYLYGEPDHDSNLLKHHLGELPVGGFFCNGEIGPIGTTTFMHGYTSAFALFRSA